MPGYLIRGAGKRAPKPPGEYDPAADVDGREWDSDRIEPLPEPVLYGLLTAGDVAELQRRQRLPVAQHSNER